MSSLVLTPQLVKLETGEFDLGTVFRLVLQRRKVRSPLDCLERCVNLRFLDLSRNEITTLGPGLSRLLLLEYLDVSHNKLGTLAGLPGQGNLLRTLRLQGNQIQRVTDLDALQGQTTIEHISFQNLDNTAPCPVCSHSQYRSALFDKKKLPNLKSLDYVRLHLPDLDEKIERMKNYNPDALFSNSRGGTTSTEQAGDGGTGNSSGSLSSAGNNNSNSSSSSGSGGWFLEELAAGGSSWEALSPSSKRQRDQAQDALLAVLKKSKDCIREVYQMVDQPLEIEPRGGSKLLKDHDGRDEEDIARPIEEGGDDRSGVEQAEIAGQDLRDAAQEGIT
ncbi:unnamed protein product [Amoebophrya sp. A25]|nr:unnamed protein product [Amoebophrya sp. A25]|eukprot:GSA25T00020639001.1